MITDRSYKEFLDNVYNIEWDKKRYRVGEGLKVSEKQYKILALEDNQNNGMQAMAVAPVNDRGEVDTSEIVIAYAGTRFSDSRDRDADWQQVVKGNMGDVIVDTSKKSTQITTKNQLQTAKEFADEILKKYPSSLISITGHSLGGYLAVFVAAKYGWAATVFNAPDASNALSEKEIEWVLKNRDLIVNYRNPRDIIGNYGGDKLGIARYVDSDIDINLIPGVSYGINLINKYHALDTWKDFDSEGNLVDKNGEIVRKTTLREIDIEKDGTIDIKIDARGLYPTPLFSGKYVGTTNGATEIIVNHDSLKILAQNLKEVIRDLETIQEIVAKVENYNNKISAEKPKRKETLQEYVVQHLKEIAVIDTIKKIDELYIQLQENRNKYRQVANYNIYHFSKQFNNWRREWVDEYKAYWHYKDTERKIQVVIGSSNEVLKTIEGSYLGGHLGSGVRDTILRIDVRTEIAKSGEKVINSFKEKIETSLRGENNRSSYDDGIVEALKEVIRVEKENIETLKKCFEYMVSAVEILSFSFDETDKELGMALASNKEVTMNYKVPKVAQDYKTFLKETNVFDDVDVLKAFDNQVDIRTKELSEEMTGKLSNYFRETHGLVKDTMDKVRKNKDYVDILEKEYGTKLYYYDKQARGKENEEPIYYGTVESSLSEAGNIKELGRLGRNIEERHARTKTEIESTQNNLPIMKSMIRSSLEEVIYGYNNLEGIIKAEKIVAELLMKIKTQATGLNNLLEQNKGKALLSVQHRLNEVLSTTSYVKTMIDDCFGDK